MCYVKKNILQNKILILLIFVLFLILSPAKNVWADSSLYQRCEPGTNCELGEFIFADDGYTPITSAGYCQITITDPADLVVANSAVMPNKSDGWYYYIFNASTPLGLYRSTICCDAGANRRCLDKTFVLGVSFDSLPAKIWTYSSRTLTAFGSLAADVWNNAFAPNRTLTSRQISANEYLAGVSTSTLVNQVASAAQVNNLQTELDAVSAKVNLIYNDTQYIRGETDTLIAKWGTFSASDIISGLSLVQAKIGTSTDATSTATIFGQIKYLKQSGGNSQLSQNIYNLASSTLIKLTATQNELGYAGTSTTAFADLQAVKNNLNILAVAVGTPADASSTPTLFGKSNQIRQSQQKNWTVYLSNFTQVLGGNTYRAKIWILNYESVPTDSFAFPTINLYDASRNLVAQNISATRISAGIYEYTYTVPGTAVQGNWETQASVQVEPGKIIQTSGYWEVAGSPAQVKINSITDNTVPAISANVIITNEGLAGYEYQYEWCVVSNISNPCGGGDDIFYSSAAKFINPGQNFITDLNATVPDAGTYYFKVVVYYGTQKSGATQIFSAIVPGAPCGDGVCGANENCGNCSADCGFCLGSGGGGGSSGGGVLPPKVVVPPTTASTSQNYPESSEPGIFNALWSAINGIFARLTGIEAKNSTLTASISGLETKITDLNNRMVALLKPAPARIIQRAPIVVVKPIAPVPTAKARVRLEVQ
jgi:hypothetical protein